MELNFEEHQEVILSQQKDENHWIKVTQQNSIDISDFSYIINYFLPYLLRITIGDIAA
jgi:hypothetical protein